MPCGLCVRRGRFSDDLGEALDAWLQQHGAEAEGEAGFWTLGRVAHALVAEVGLACLELPATLRGRVELPAYAVSLVLRVMA